MRCLRRLLVAAAALSAVVAAFAAPHASAGGPCAVALPRILTSQHFSVSYDDDPKNPDYLGQTQAGVILAAAERAWSSYVNDMGFAAPAVESSGKTEFYIADLSAQQLSAMYCAGAAQLDVTTVNGAEAEYTISATIFNEIEFGLTPFGTAQWLMNGAAAWATWHALGYPAGSATGLGPYDMSLDCNSAADKANCQKSSGYVNLGDSRWPFYEYLVEKFGNSIITDIFTAANGATALTAVSNVLAAKGTMLSAEYGSYAAKLLTGGWTIAAPLNAATIPVSGSPIFTGASTGPIPSQSFGVNHLATKFVEIDRGDGAGDHACYEASLQLDVQIPTGVTSQPTFYWSGDRSTPVPLTITGSKATTTVLWDTCSWSSKGFLSLPNTSLSNGTSFTVSGKLTVDFSKPTAAATPPPKSVQYGQTVETATLSQVPELSLFGPSILKLASGDKVLRLIVRSDGDGSASFALGSTKLGSVAVRAGGNDIHLALPTSLLQTLRRSAGAFVLSMTPVAPDGVAAGAAQTRKVLVGRVAVKKPTKTLAHRRK
jgi:hypothetical protein